MKRAPLIRLFTSARAFVPCCALTAVLATAAGCPPFDALQFPEGEGEGEGEGDVEGACPAVATVPVCTTALAGQLDNWERFDVDSTVDAEVSAMALDASAGRLIIATVDAQLWAMSASGVTTLLDECTDAGNSVFARRLFVASDGAVIASGTGGVCVFDGVDPIFVLPKAGEVTAVPLDAVADAVAVVSNSGGLFTVEHHTRAGAELTAVATLATDLVMPNYDAASDSGSDVVAAAPDPGGGAFLVDEVGQLYVITGPPSVALTVGGKLDGVAPTGVVLATTSDTAEVAIDGASSLVVGSIALTTLEAGDVAPLTEIVRDAAAFPRSNDRVDHIAVDNGARLDVGGFGYATFAPPGAAPVPVGTCARVADLDDLVATPCGVMWGLTSGGAVVAWSPDAARTEAVATLVTSSASLPGFGADRLVPVGDGNRVLIGNADGVIVATLDGDTLSVDAADTNKPVVGMAVEDTGTYAVAVNADGSVVAFDPATPRTSLRVLTGTVGNTGGDSSFDLTASPDPFALPGELRFFAAGDIGGEAALIGCEVDTTSDTLSCSDPVKLDGLALPLRFSRIAALTTSGFLVVTDQGVSYTVPGSSSVLVNQDLVGEQTPFDDGRGRIVDTGGGCVLVFGFSPTPYFFDAADPTPSLIAATRTSHDPFISVATLVEPGHIAGSGGIGGTFYDLRFDATASTCAARFNATDAAVLGPTKVPKAMKAAAFLEGRAYVGDELGDVYRLPDIH